MITKNNVLTSWDLVDGVTRQILENIPDSLYHKRPFEGRFRTFAWEYACFFTTREMYINGFAAGKFDGNTEQSDEKYIESLDKAEMKKLLDESGDKIRAIITGAPKEIDFFGDILSRDEFISWLLQHEQFHFGRLVLLCSQAGVPIPKSLKKMWGEGSFAPKSRK